MPMWGMENLGSKDMLSKLDTPIELPGLITGPSLGYYKQRIHPLQEGEQHTKQVVQDDQK